ncbi:hypothetical protein C4566_02700 [Candidatus Parcubacteria bacterium]|nr:MAG: hypothetical protein C4566_02700 [Candidatus Parcubacteria bacterium]
MKLYISVFLLLVILTLGGCFNKQVSNTNEGNQNNNVVVSNENENTQSDEEITKEYDLAEISKHSTAEDCWLLIDGKVYDVTAFIASGKHGGGDAILAGCGIDATELFKTRPMGTGTDHSEKAYSFLPNFYIGDLKK